MVLSSNKRRFLGLDATLLDNQNKLTECAKLIVARLNNLAEAHAGTWEFELLEEGGVSYYRNRRGVMQNCVLDADLLKSQEAFKLTNLYPDLFDVFGAGSARLTLRPPLIRLLAPLICLKKLWNRGAKA